MRRTFLITLILAAVGLTACGPKGPFYLNQNFKDYVVYNPGSYWVYHDMNSGLKDCVVAISNNYSMVILEGAGLAEKEQSVVSSYSATYGDSIFKVTGESNGPESSCGFGADSNNVLYAYFGYPYNTKDYGSYYLFNGGPDSIRINNKIYRDVISFTDTDQQKTVYWSRHTGIIKATSRGKTWVLDTCVVNQ